KNGRVAKNRKSIFPVMVTDSAVTNTRYLNLGMVFSDYQPISSPGESSESSTSSAGGNVPDNNVKEIETIFSEYVFQQAENRIVTAGYGVHLIKGSGQGSSLLQAMYDYKAQWNGREVHNENNAGASEPFVGTNWWLNNT
ncbi:hypothetical protein, partial [Methanosarcina mazei]|uniref:hypothetical protein n=1 Tax=Methanosarcina mazei TaxID=2209 RepID=UPI00064FB392